MTALRFCTIANAAYLPMVAQLAHAVKAQHPDAVVTLALVEREHLDPGRRALLSDVDEVMLAETVFGGGFAEWLDGRSPYIAACALKPALLRVLVARNDAMGVIQLDPDMDLIGPCDATLPHLSAGDALITPHLVTPGRPQTVIPQDELNVFRYGAYNLGFIGVGRSASSLEFLDWWDSRVRLLCTTDEPSGPYTDQGWIDLTPGMFEAVRVFRHPGFNLATWDALNRIVERTRSGALEVNGEPLVACHYSGWYRGDHAFALRGVRDANPLFGELSDAFGTRLAAREALFGAPPAWSFARASADA